MTDRKMTWRYVMARERLPSGEEIYTMRELYTGVGRSVSWTNEPAIPQGNSWVELSQEIVKLGNAIWRREILDLTLDPPRVVPR